MKLSRKKITPTIKLKATRQEENFRSGKNISRICLETLPKKKINNQLDIKLRKFTDVEFDSILKELEAEKR